MASAYEWALWWDLTIARWRGEGLPARLKSHFDVREYLGLDPYHQVWSRPRARGFPAMPHGQGPVATEADYEALLPHLYPPQGEHLDELAAWGRRQARGEVVVWLSLEGFFWYPRTLFGIQPHLTAFYDLPDLMQRMNRDLAEYHVRYLNEVRKVCCPAFMTFAETCPTTRGPCSPGAVQGVHRAALPARGTVLQEMGTGKSWIRTHPGLMIDGWRGGSRCCPSSGKRNDAARLAPTIHNS